MERKQTKGNLAYADAMYEPQAEKTAIQAVPEIFVVPAKRKVYMTVKRVFDILVAVVCLTVGLPVYLLIALAIVIDDFGNPLFIQQRVGKDGRVFRMVKFRTMYQNAEQMKESLATENKCDCIHCVTRVGRFLRRTSLDETAQAINLLTGSMTVIGPRPFIPSEQAQLPMNRLVVKPGLSCYWQLVDTTKMGIEEQLELDYRYIREMSVGTDLKLIGKTIIVILLGQNF